MKFPLLLSPFRVGDCEFKNRLIFGSHATSQTSNGLVTEALIAYHETRAMGGVGLIILESATVHDTYAYPEHFLCAMTDDVIPGLARLTERIHSYDCKVFGQLFHAGRAVRLSSDGSRPVPYGASPIADERYRVVPAPMSNELVWDVIHHYARAAGRMAEAGCDGVEILVGMGYLVSQFLNPRVNLREDEFGGSSENRLRLLREILKACRQTIGENRVLGIRISGEEMDDIGLSLDETLAVCRAVQTEVDYINVIAGSSHSPQGWVHVFPPMTVEPGFAASAARSVKAAVSKPVFVGGRINQPQLAEAALAEGQADMIAMARPLICDPDFVNKLSAGRSEDIRACIGCNQACVGHRLNHHVVSCIQHPESGRELKFRDKAMAPRRRRVLVVGGGPAGMKAALVADERGHEVTLVEKGPQFGGQVLLAQRLPGWAEFGGASTNLERALSRSNVKLKRNLVVEGGVIANIEPEVVVIATGATPCAPSYETLEDIQWVDSWDVIAGLHKVQGSVVIADRRADWVGLGVAEMLALSGHGVRLVVNGCVAGELIQPIVRDHWIGRLHRLGVEVVPYMRLFGASGGAVLFQHTVTGEPWMIDDAKSLVLTEPHESNSGLADLCRELGLETHVIGDALAPRTVEEAVLEGMKVACIV